MAYELKESKRDDANLIKMLHSSSSKRSWTTQLCKSICNARDNKRNGSAKGHNTELQRSFEVLPERVITQGNGSAMVPSDGNAVAAT
jgi:hypothetical protein